MNNRAVIPCEQCHKSLRVPADRGTLRIRCPHCQTQFVWTPDPPGEPEPERLKREQESLGYIKDLSFDDLLRVVFNSKEQIDKYYKILGLNPGASEAEIKQAYKDLVNVWRADRFSDDPRLKENANERLREINIAFGNLISSMNQENEGHQASEKQDHAEPHSPRHEPPPRSEKANYTSGDKGSEESEPPPKPPPKKPFVQPPVKAIYAGFWNRFAASFIDSVIVLIGGFLLSLPFLIAEGMSTATTYPFWVIFEFIVSLVIGWLYFTLLESSTKQATIGKMAVRIIVTDLNGRRIRFGRANGRYWGKVISFLILGFGYIITGFTRKKQALHDIMADTLVLARPEGVRSWVTTTIIGGPIVILLVGISILVFNLQDARNTRDTQTASVPPSNMKGEEDATLNKPQGIIDPLEVEQKRVIPQEAPTPPGPSPAKIALTPSQVFDKVKDTVVVVKTLDTRGKLKILGSGVLLPSDRVATNCHVVEGGASYLVGRGKELVRATLYAEDGDKDICILDAKGITGNPVQLGKAASLQVGEKVYAVGAPQGLELSLSDGIVAQLRGGPPPLIQTTAAISPGSSGGGLFDGEGRLVGLTILSLEGGQSLNFAIPVEWINEVKPGRKPATEGRSRTEWLKRATALEQMKDWQGLLDWCRKWTESEPEDADAWNSLGCAYDILKRYNDAIEAFRQALRINPKDVYAWNSLGNAYFGLDRYDDAIKAYRQALRINPEYAIAWNSLGFAYNSLKRYNDAIEALRQALRIDPEFAFAWNSLGCAYNSLKRYNDAIKAYRQALRISPEFAFAWYNLGNAYNSLKRYNDAIKAYRQALRISPKDAAAWNSLGCAYNSLKRYNDAIKAYRQALRINPEYAEVWYNLGIAYYNSGNRTAALDAVRELRRLDPALAGELYNWILSR